MGSHCGEVLRDVLPMYACHLLLGRPYLFDNHMIYDGHGNTYSLKHNGCNLALTQLYTYPNLSKLLQEREARKTFTRVKHGMNMPLVRASLNCLTNSQAKHK